MAARCCVANPDDPIELIDDLTAAPQSAGRTSIRADRGGSRSGVRAIEKVDGLTRELRRPVVSIRRMRRHVALVRAESVRVRQRSQGPDDKSFDDGYTRPVLAAALDGTANDHKSDRGTMRSPKRRTERPSSVCSDPRRHLP